MNEEENKSLENGYAESELNVKKPMVNENTYTRDEVKLYFSINFIYGIIKFIYFLTDFELYFSINFIYGIIEL